MRRESGRAVGQRIAILCTITAALWLILAPTAGAELTGQCDGSATIDGIEYDASFDTAANPIVVPAEREGLRIPYEGSVTMQNTNYLGAVGVVIGPVTVNVADWGLDENSDDIRETGPDSVYILGNELNNIVGIYELTAFHDADGGNCDATAMVKLDGPVLATALGAGATAGTVVAGIGMLAAGIPKGRKP